MLVSKRGQYSLGALFLGLLGLFIIAVLAVSISNYNQSRNFASSVGEGVNTVSGVIMAVGGPLFNVVLGLDRPGISPDNQFLIVLTFILVSIIIIGTLDSVNIFGGNESSKFINFAVGIIVSIIGIRFMPVDLWSSLTAPSSALVATILVAVPFGALFFVSMKFNSHLVRKLLWLFYIVFMSYLIFTGPSNGFKWVYTVFLILAGIMMFFDSTVRRYVHMEKGKLEIEDIVNKMSAVQRFKLREQIKEWQSIIGDSSSPVADIAAAKLELAKLRKRYGDISAI